MYVFAHKSKHIAYMKRKCKKGKFKKGLNGKNGHGYRVV
jgi:hypothetical protein